MLQCGATVNELGSVCSYVTANTNSVLRQLLNQQDVALEYQSQFGMLYTQNGHVITSESTPLFIDGLKNEVLVPC